VNGNWGVWGRFGSCNKACGRGLKYRYRACNKPAPAHGGKACPGLRYHGVYCNTHHCPGNFFVLEQAIVIVFFNSSNAPNNLSFYRTYFSTTQNAL